LTVNLRKTQIKTTVDPYLFVAIMAVMCAGLACQSATQSTGSAVDSGDENIAKAKLLEAEPLYEARADMNKARVAVAVLRQARVADYGNYEVAWKLARAAYYVGDHTGDDDERDDMFREGIESGTAAVKLQGDKPEGHFWLGANYGGSAAHSTLASLANVQDIKREMEAVIKIDEGYQGGSAYMGLGRLYLQAPRVLGGDATKAINYLEQGLKFGPNNALLRFHLAEAYAAADRTAEARKQIDALLAITPDPKYVAEHNDAVAKAKKLQQKIDRGE
jgi:tetratricopeptide (TPR) repeat protein